MPTNYTDGESSDLELAMLNNSSAFVSELEEVLSCSPETTVLAGGKALSLS